MSCRFSGFCGIFLISSHEACLGHDKEPSQASERAARPGDVPLSTRAKQGASSTESGAMSLGRDPARSWTMEGIAGFQGTLDPCGADKAEQDREDCRD